MSVGGISTVAPAATARATKSSTAFTYSITCVALPPSVSGDLLPHSRFSSVIISIESPMRNSACMMPPPGPVMHTVCFAPNARV